MVSVKEFCRLSGYCENIVAVSNFNAKRTGKPTKLSVYYDKERKMMDLNRFLKDKRKTNDVINACHTFYYPAVEITGSDSKLARILSKITKREKATWTSWMNGKLFKRAEENQHILEPSVMHQEFFWITISLFVIGTKHGLIKYNDWIY